MSDHDLEELLKPREVARLFGVRSSTIALWARTGKLTPIMTPGGHRRYARRVIREMLAQAMMPDGEDRLQSQRMSALFA